MPVQYRRYRRKTRAPYRKTRRSYRRTRRTRRYGGYRRRLPTMLGWKLVTKLKYESSNVLSFPAPGSPSIWVFRANSLHDPDQSGGGHQPRGFDQIAPMYDHYVVIGAKIRVTFIPRGDVTDTNDSMYVGISCKDTQTGLSSANDYIESRSCTYRAIMVNQVEQRSPTLTMSVNPNRFLGISKPLSSPDVRAFTNANPTDGVYFHVFAEPLATADTPNPVRIQVFIQYTCVFVEPKTPGQS